MAFKEAKPSKGHLQSQEKQAHSRGSEKSEALTSFPSEVLMRGGSRNKGRGKARVLTLFSSRGKGMSSLKLPGEPLEPAKFTTSGQEDCLSFSPVHF